MSRQRVHLVFGALVLLRGRSGDLLGRRRIFITGIPIFAGASLLGGFGTDQAWHARGVADVSSPPDAPKPGRRPEPGRPR